jgi:hypothetical protein
MFKTTEGLIDKMAQLVRRVPPTARRRETAAKTSTPCGSIAMHLQPGLPRETHVRKALQLITTTIDPQHRERLIDDLQPTTSAPSATTCYTWPSSMRSHHPCVRWPCIPRSPNGYSPSRTTSYATTRPIPAGNADTATPAPPT